jgi:hypothetical protein
VFDHSWPARGVEVRGLARIGAEGRAELSRRLSIRYLGPVNGNAYADRMAPGLVIRVEPGIVRAWDFVDETPPDLGIAVFPGLGRPSPSEADDPPA